MNVPEKWKDLAHAWVDGAAIEARHRAIRLEWGNVDFPTWSEDFEYRIKPKAKVKKWRYWYKSTADYYTEEGARVANFGPKVEGSMIEVDDE